MDINRVQEKKKGAGAGARSNKVRVSLFNLCFGPPAQLNSCSGCAWHSHSGLFWVLPLAEVFLGTFGLEMAQAGCEFHFQEFLMQSLNSACYWVLNINLAALMTELVLLKHFFLIRINGSSQSKAKIGVYF